jgi:hypothetical protein
MYRWLLIAIKVIQQVQYTTNISCQPLDLSPFSELFFPDGKYFNSTSGSRKLLYCGEEYLLQESQNSFLFFFLSFIMPFFSSPSLA